MADPVPWHVGHLNLLTLQAALLPNLTRFNLKIQCLHLEQELLPYLLFAQVRHIQAFGDSFPALQRRYSSLNARLLALLNIHWQQKLDRDAAGRSFFAQTSAPLAFSHPSGACFYASSPVLRGPATLAIDVEKIEELEYGAIRAFMRRILPCCHKLSLADDIILAKLWLIFECVYKSVGKEALLMELTEKSIEILMQENKLDISLSSIKLHARYFSSRGYLGCVTSPNLPANHKINCEWLDLDPCFS